MSVYFKYDASKGCPKCGMIATRDKYCRVFNKIERHCPKCSYDWKELPLDSQVEVEHVPYLEPKQ